MKYWWLVILLAGVFGCEPPHEASSGGVAKSVEQPSAQYHYSPFVVQVPNSAMVFDTITFKDVGLHRGDDGSDNGVLETIAESISYEIQSAPELAVHESSVEYVAEYSDPAAHLSCETEHLYVDVWNRDALWGYSLWSGCGEADNFAWEEVEGVVPAPESLADGVAPLAGSIAEKLIHAHHHKCFVKRC